MAYDNILADPNEDQTVEDAVPTPLPPVEPYGHLAGVAPDLNTHTLAPDIAKALSEAILTHEATTGEPSPIRDLHAMVTGNNPLAGDMPAMHGVHPDLISAVRGGSQYLPEGYTVHPVSGVRTGNRQSYHRGGNASDWQIYGPDGKAIPNRGADATGMYTLLARGVKTWAEQNRPDLIGPNRGQIGYGGAFGTQIGGGGVPDLMHYDLGGSRGRMNPSVQFANLVRLAGNTPDMPILRHYGDQPFRPFPGGGDVPIPSRQPRGNIDVRTLGTQPEFNREQPVPAETITQEEYNKLFPGGAASPVPEAPAEESPSESNLLDLLLAQAAPKTPPVDPARQMREATAPTNEYLTQQLVPPPATEDDLQAELEAMLQPATPAPAPSGMNPIWPPQDPMTPEQARAIPAYMRPQNKFATQPTEAGVDPSQARQAQSENMEPLRQLVQSLGPDAVAAIPAAVGAIGGVASLPFAAASYAGAGPVADYPASWGKALFEKGMGAASSVDAAGREITQASTHPHGWAKAADLLGTALSPGKFGVPLRMFNTGAHGLGEFIMPSAHAEDPFASTTTVDTIGGPARVKWEDLKALGPLAVLTLGAAFAPSAFNKLKYNIMPKVFNTDPWVITQAREVRHAVPGTLDTSTAKDYARSVGDDANRGIVAGVQRAYGGLDPAAIQDLEETLQIMTRANAHAIAANAVMNGWAETPNFAFKVSRSLNSLNKGFGADADAVKYLHLQNIRELQYEKWYKAVQRGAANAGPPRVRGIDYADTAYMINAIETARPELKQVADAYRENVAEMRKFQASMGNHGEYATMSAKDLRSLGRARKNFIPGKYNEDLREPLSNPFESLAVHMQNKMVQRMENEGTMLAIDTAHRAPKAAGQRMYKRVNTKNPEWKKNTVTGWRRGKKESYSTSPLLADLHKMDPYFFSSGVAGRGVRMYKNLFEANTTGGFAPWFAVTSAERNFAIGAISSPKGYKPYRPWDAVRSVAAVPQDLLPRLAKAMSEALDRGSNGMLSNIFGQSTTDAVSLWMAQKYSSSLVARLQANGLHRGSVMEKQTYDKQRLQKALQGMPMSTAKTLLNGYMNLLQAVHNSTGLGWASKNAKTATATGKFPQLANQVRRLTGDPHTTGRYSTRPFPGAEPRRIRFDPGENATFGERADAATARMYGRVSEAGREYGPWFNPTQQGIKQLAHAYLENPAAFMTRVWLYGVVPQYVGSMWNQYLGKDPQGNSYYDYQVNGRSPYASATRFYIGIPGRPVHEGVEWNTFQEITLPKMMTEAFYDHLFNTNIFTDQEDLENSIKSFLDITVYPPTPPVLTLADAMTGRVGPQNLMGYTKFLTDPMGITGFGGAMTGLGGSTYEANYDPFNPNAGMPGSMNMVARTALPGIASIVGAAYNAAVHTPDSLTQAIKNGLFAGGRQIVQNTSIARDIFGVYGPPSGNTRTQAELFQKADAIKQLMFFFDTYGITGTPIIGRKKPISKSGEALASAEMGTHLPTTSFGLDLPEPTNPLYLRFIQEVHNKFQLDATKHGGIGYKSQWQYYREVNKNIRFIRNIDPGNQSRWAEKINSSPDLVALLDENRVDKSNPIDVRAFLEHKRQNYARTILHTIKEVEHEFSQAIGKPITLEDLKPYTESEQKQLTTGEDTPTAQPGYLPTGQ